MIRSTIQPIIATTYLPCQPSPPIGIIHTITTTHKKTTIILFSLHLKQIMVDNNNSIIHKENEENNPKLDIDLPPRAVVGYTTCVSKMRERRRVWSINSHVFSLHRNMLLFSTIHVIHPRVAITCLHCSS
jgi:hypothetical protein